MSGTAPWILICIAAYVWLAWLLRRDRFSLGLPLAYLTGLLLIHVPGAAVPLFTDMFDFNAGVVEIGIRLAAIASLCFVAGVLVARLFNRKKLANVYVYVERREFWYFCLIGGLIVSFGLKFLGDMPSLRSAIDRGSALWMLGAMLGLRWALSRVNVKATVTWSLATMVYPVLVLLLGGFMSYGSAAVINVASALVVSARSALKLVAVGTLLVYLGLTVFVNYFEHRTEYRDVAWSSAGFGSRVDAAIDMFSGFHWFDPYDDQQLNALDKRLNQNYFVGMAALRLQQEQVSYLYGRSISDGVLALVPRALWPDKPVYGGSGRIVADMTGLDLNEETSWGVGNVMEFDINFGTPGVAIGFLILGFLLGWLDYKAAYAEARGDIGKLLLFFLVGVALIQPGGSIVEITGGAAAAAVAAFAWRWIWEFWLRRNRQVSAPARQSAAWR
ncbi:MAG: hypothetical protein WAM75_08795 [Xanthobacteraceae bacterium]